jgi:DNA mismatch endonuclease, patch repair protein
MSDRLSAQRRSWNMSRIRSKNTIPERTVRSLLHFCGYRFRLHQRNLPGTPDIILKKYFTVIFVHGCFWHQHRGCKYAYKPKSHIAYWEPKLKKNVERYSTNKRELRQLGWRVITVWECELGNLNALAKRLTRGLTGDRVNK